MGDEMLRGSGVELADWATWHPNHSVKLNSMPRSLDEYQRKRDFSKTPEPKGTPEPRGQNRFVVQKHWATRLHYAFPLKRTGALVHEALPTRPTLHPPHNLIPAHT